MMTENKDEFSFYIVLTLVFLQSEFWDRTQAL